jgi:hypothetical protein
VHVATPDASRADAPTAEPPVADHRSSTIAEPFKETSPLPEKPVLNAEATAVGDWATTWSAVSSPSGCFFFSGPAGRDTPLTGPAQLTFDGEYAKLVWGGATFEGSVHAGAFSLARHAQHTYGGEWTVTETLVGTMRDHTAVAKYHYQECSTAECPGRCTIDADLALLAKP